jgi:hypothetical protein
MRVKHTTKVLSKEMSILQKLLLGSLKNPPMLYRNKREVISTPRRPSQSNYTKRPD